MKKIANIRIDKKTLIAVGSIIATVIIFYLLISPLFAEVRKIGGEVKALENEMAAARQAIASKGDFQNVGELLTRKQVTLAINEITKAGAVKGINFLSISPQKIVKSNNSKYPVLPISMNIQSEYSDLGIFLGVLEDKIVAVKSFEIDAERHILPQIKTDLVVEVYFQEGEDG